MFQGEPSLVPGVLRGYRTWGERYGGLRSTGMDHTWGGAAEVEQAMCQAWPLQTHSAPDADCKCGLYGWYDPADSRIVDAPVFGVIEVSGRVILGTHGFRAERARVLAVTAEHADDRALFRQRGYTVYDTRDALLADYPPDDVSELARHECDGTCQERASALNWIRLGVSVGGGTVSWSLPHGTQMQAMSDALTKLTRAAHRVAAASADFTTYHLATWATAPQPDPSPAVPLVLTPQQRALEARRNRNTGPQQRRTPPPRTLR